MMRSIRQLDRRDFRLLRAKHDSPSTPLDVLAQRVEMPLSTAKRRLAAMAKQGIFSEVIQIEAVLERAVVAIDCNARDIANHGRDVVPYSDVFTFARFLQTRFWETISPDLREIVLIERVEVILGGENDILLFIAAENSTAILEVVTGYLAKLPGVVSTRTGVRFSQKALQAISAKSFSTVERVEHPTTSTTKRKRT